MPRVSRPWLMGSCPTWRVSQGSSFSPMRTDRIRKAIIFPKTIRIWMALPPSATATNVESSRITKTSSKTAAPNNPKPTRLRSTFISIKVWAEILTLVAPNVSPRKMEFCNVRPYISPATAPNATGKMTPKIPPRADTLVFCFNSSRWSSRPARNIRIKTPNSPR